MKYKFHHYKTLSSTNTKALELAAAGAVHGEAVRAENQTAGRGRLGREWISPNGKGLYFSVILRPKISPEDYPKITMTAGLATAVALEKICGKPFVLKWPNDVFISEKKCCGILAESALDSTTSHDRFAIVGIGVNVLAETTDFPNILRNRATSILIETGRHFDLDVIFKAIHAELMDHVTRLEQDGFALILERWKRKDFLYGRWLEWVTNSGEIVYGRSEGPDDSGTLLVRDRNGRLHDVISGDVSVAAGSGA